MSATQDSPNRTLKGKKSVTAPPISASPVHAAPTTFFLRSERDIERDAQRGRKASRDSEPTMNEESSFGVQSLEETIASTSFTTDDSLSRTNSNLSEASVEAGADFNVLAGRKRKAGNPVHPRILATGQRIISSERHVYRTESPLSHRSGESPFRSHGRRNSASSSVILSRPLSPLRMSPRPESAMPSTPRSGSPKSFRLSDEEQSVASDSGSQAIHSSSSDENESFPVLPSKNEAMPQLVMPSISMPARRPFTENGQRLGRLKVMVVGPRGVGKTSLIQSICRMCVDVVHMDSISGSSGMLDSNDTAKGPTDQIMEIGVSTRPYPSWWTDLESRRMLLRRKSMGEGVLERNLTFIDTPGLDGGSTTLRILKHFKDTQSRMGNMARMNDSELISMLSGEGGVQIDVVLFLFEPALASSDKGPALELNHEQIELLRYVCKWTNVIPLIGRADTLGAEEVHARKEQLLSMFEALGVERCVSPEVVATAEDDQTTIPTPTEPYAISCALGDDSETIDASILMSSGYLQPLMPSQLGSFIEGLLQPENTARLRHLSATKFLLWRQENLGAHLDLQRQTLLHSPRFAPSSPCITSDGSMLEESSRVVVPHGSSNFFRSASPSASDCSALSGSGNVIATSAQALAKYNDQTKTTEPYRQVRLAKWAQDLQRGLENERKRYAQMFTMSPFSDGPTSTSNGDSEKAISADLNNSLVTTTTGTSRPPKGCLGGDLGIIDPRDPLGLLAFGQAFRRRGWFALQIAGSCGLIGAVAWYAAKNWADFQEFLGFGPPAPAVTLTAVPPPTSREWWDVADWRNLLGMQR